ncbi:MAG: HypC/HybG/HupF family hydrogenase formation chaperone [Deltaproteobacteria bacterium]|nr:HypC/HybG/HupF family hydrogenase formation chaperone [Deltaproteobacteria bacterium]MBW2142300.1 HypC/HybG/HupF family hydrogenase formation chaperone [Deltaproteobacteria bacterium]
MCLAVPSYVKTVDGEEAEIETSGVTRRISIAVTPDVKVGDYVLIHAGYALTVLSEDEAMETLKHFKEITDF